MPCNQEHTRQSQSLSWENCNDISKYVRHKWAAGVFSSVTYTKKSAASNKACLTSLSRLGNLKPSPTYTAHRPQHTDTISIVKFTLKPFKLLDKESLTHRHYKRYSLRK